MCTLQKSMKPLNPQYVRFVTTRFFIVVSASTMGCNSQLCDVCNSCNLPQQHHRLLERIKNALTIGAFSNNNEGNAGASAAGVAAEIAAEIAACAAASVNQKVESPTQSDPAHRPQHSAIPVLRAQ